MRRRTWLVVLAAVAIVVTACGSSNGGASPEPSTSGATNTASAPGVTSTTITVGYIADLTGVASASAINADKAARARIDAINAAGGVDGRKIKLIVEDTQSSSTGFLTAAQDLVSKGVFGIMNGSVFGFTGAKYLHDAGVPVVGYADGPEWGEQPYTNMFSWQGGIDPHYPAYTTDGLFFKSIGVRNVAGLAYGISPGSVNSIKDLKESLNAVGIKMGYENLSVPFGAVDFTADALAMKQAGVDGATCSCVQSTNIAMVVAARQTGIHLKGALVLSGPDSSLFADKSATDAAQGTYWPSLIVPIDVHNPATETFVANLRKYDSTYKGGYPNFGSISSYLSADLMIEGLQVAGHNPTRASFITNLAKVKAWDANGLMASPVGFNHFGHQEPRNCGYITKVEGDHFVTINHGKPYCGKLIPNSNVA